MSSELVTERPPGDDVTAADATSARGATAPDVPTEPRREIWFHRRLSLRTQMQEIWQFRELAVTLAERDLRARYKQAVLGFAWAVLSPLMLMVAFTLIFTRFAKVNAHGIPYPLFAYMALIPWTFFSSSVSTGGSSLVSNMSVLNKVYCPRELFPLASMVVAAVDAVISVGVLAILFIVTGTAPKPESAYILLLLPVLVVFTTAVTLIVSSVLVYLRDLRHALPLLLQFALLATPVAYGLEAIAKSRTFVLVYAAINPLAPVIDGFRRTALYGHPPDWVPLLVATCASLLLLVGSYKVFKRLETGLADIA
jgi:ABC-2 type transport system permease protein/lipopolysaccharide transport system permease protein